MIITEQLFGCEHRRHRMTLHLITDSFRFSRNRLDNEMIAE